MKNGQGRWLYKLNDSSGNTYDNGEWVAESSLRRSQGDWLTSNVRGQVDWILFAFFTVWLVFMLKAAVREIVEYIVAPYPNCDLEIYIPFTNWILLQLYSNNHLERMDSPIDKVLLMEAGDLVTEHSPTETTSASLGDGQSVLPAKHCSIHILGLWTVHHGFPLLNITSHLLQSLQSGTLCMVRFNRPRPMFFHWSRAAAHCKIV